MGIRINKIFSHFPDNKVTNDDVTKVMPTWTPEKISKKLGINNRFRISENETSLDLAIRVCEKAKKEIDFNLIDGLILCTQSPDYFLPTTSCILQDRVGLKKTTACFDFNLGCSGYVYGLAIVKGMINSGVLKNVLFVTAETYSKFISPNDGSNLALFGDAATVTHIVKSEIEHIFEFSLGTDGMGYKNLIVEYGGSRNLAFDAKPHLFMNGPEIFSFSETIIIELVKDVLFKNNLSKEDIDYFVFHQANDYLLKHLMTKLNIDSSKFIVYMSEFGNTVSNTIPIVLEKMIKDFDLHEKKIMLVGFGVGYSWGATIINLK